MGPQRRSLHAEIDRTPFGHGPVARPSDECEEETCAPLGVVRYGQLTLEAS